MEKHELRYLAYEEMDRCLHCIRINNMAMAAMFHGRATVWEELYMEAGGDLHSEKRYHNMVKEYGEGLKAMRSKEV